MTKSNREMGATMGGNVLEESNARGAGGSTGAAPGNGGAGGNASSGASTGGSSQGGRGGNSASAPRHLTEYTLTDEQGRPRPADAAEPRRTPVEQAGHERNVKAVEGHGAARSSVPLGLAEAERLYGKGSPMWQVALWMQRHPGYSVDEIAAGPLQHGQHVANAKEMLAMFGATQYVVEDPDGRKRVVTVPSQTDIDEHRKAIAADNRIRARAGLPLLEATDGAPQPDPAPGQVWLPPEGACPKGWADDDGTLTVLRTEGGSARFTNGCFGHIGSMTDPAGGWTCIGVATPHGRVMVGDEFVGTMGGDSLHVSGVIGGDVVLAYEDGDPRGTIGAMHLLGGYCGYLRTRYATARAGERYRHRVTGGVVAAVAGDQMLVERWERLDPGASDDARDGQTIRIKRPASIVQAERERAVAATDDERAPRPLESFDDFKARMVTRVNQEQDRILAASSPLTATGADLDKATRLYGVPSRGKGETDESLRARCMDAMRRASKLGTSSEPPRTHTHVTVPITDADRERAAQTIAMRNGVSAAIYLAAPARDLRAFHDAIGRALESAAPHGATVAGRVYLVKRDEMLFAPEVAPAADVRVITADTKHLCVLRASVAQALADGRSYACQWGKGRVLAVERVGGPLVTAQSSPEPAATHYDGAQGGPDAWRWEVGE